MCIRDSLNTIISKKSLRDIISDVIKAVGVARACAFLDGIKNLGYYMAFKGGLSFNLGDIIIPVSYTHLCMWGHAPDTHLLNSEAGQCNSPRIQGQSYDECQR